MNNSSLKRKWDNQNVLDYAVEEAVKEADLKARADERIKATFEEKKAIAGDFKKMGINFRDIAKCTGLSIEEIEKL